MSSSSSTPQSQQTTTTTTTTQQKPPPPPTDQDYQSRETAKMVPFPINTPQLFTPSSKPNTTSTNEPANPRNALTPLKDTNNRLERMQQQQPAAGQSQPAGHKPFVHPPPSVEPTMSELLAASANIPGIPAFNNDGAGFMSDVRGDNGLVSWRKGQGFRAWESAILANPEVQRKANVAQLYFYDHYFDLLTYLNGRKKRLALFRETSTRPEIDPGQAGMEWRSYCGRERALLRKRRTKLKLDSFHIIVQVGQGGYGEVYLARHKLSKEVVALKKMKKKTLLKMDEVRHVLTERDILTATSKSDWLVKLLYAFQDPDYIYLAMEFVPGGDVRTLLNNSGVLKEEHAKFYATEMFVAVDSLHRLGYIHRDLKPENFLIDRSGHIKLTDFGLAAGSINPGKIQSLKHRLDEAKDENLQLWRSTVEMKTIYKTLRLQEPRYADSIVGSPDYMAIEVLRGQSYSFSVDYWSLGCILFEFLSGYAPFAGSSPEETWANLKNWSKVLRRPHYDKPEDQIFNLSDEAWLAIVALINAKEKRCSSIEQVKKLGFFADLQWDDMRQVGPPFIPSLDSEIDAGYFDDFGNPEEMKKYGEVFEKARAVELVQERAEAGGPHKNNCRGVWVGFTFKGGKTAELLRGAVPSDLPPNLAPSSAASLANPFREFGDDDVLECMF
ncbi:AGC protein kinase [Puccinia graminis f. sp. tritici CRL 75-36-700-3]|uniref:non-specific serine/threonine protein kinase n=1 Tax=Puccinia graminis f. sp. tritici (strain CRL 75-36-700-3 / race SCCL) TaxID=418459 RepID=E3KKG0_PUCGT|nr:AGC protein kinase [Puccinia graminis f. sp. tritici CRL 75-36-700-3]EFP84785.1 AGC protein kinase [Puccinia graminis f. sp. tritici CRL 75-36-700-3]